MTDWNISESDDEWKIYEDTTEGDKLKFHIPERIAKLFTEIENQTVLQLSCYCPRSGPGESKDSNLQNTTPQQTVTLKEEKIEQDKLSTPEQK